MSEIRRQKDSPLLAEDLQRLANFRLMDDDFFSETLNGKKEAVEFIINTVLERDDLEVVSTMAQRPYKSASKRSITLDIWAKDKDGRITDIEIQRDDAGAGARRARFHSSMMDRDLLEKNQKFDEIAETFVIFITENDIYRSGLPLYHIERKITELDNRLFGDGAHIVYVNGKFQDPAHPVGRMMHDFWCTDAADMYNPVLADEVRYMKETEGGQRQMCEAMEKMREESREEGRAEGRAEGKAEGKVIAIYEFVRDGIITPCEGAVRANQTEEEFKSGMDAYFT